MLLKGVTVDVKPHIIINIGDVHRNLIIKCPLRNLDIKIVFIFDKTLISRIKYRTVVVAKCEKNIITQNEFHVIIFKSYKSLNKLYWRYPEYNPCMQSFIYFQGLY